jgi:hypothetical protein
LATTLLSEAVVSVETGISTLNVLRQELDLGQGQEPAHDMTGALQYKVGQ